MIFRIYNINLNFKYVYILRTKVHLYILWWIRWTSFVLTLFMITERIATIVSILIFYSFLNLLSKKMRWQNLESSKVVLWYDTLQASEDWLKLDLTKLLWTSFRTTSKFKESEILCLENQVPKLDFLTIFWLFDSKN